VTLTNTSTSSVHIGTPTIPGVISPLYYTIPAFKSYRKLEFVFDNFHSKFDLKSRCAGLVCEEIFIETILTDLSRCVIVLTQAKLKPTLKYT